MCNLVEHKIEALDYWQNNGNHSPKCLHCDKEIRWGKGFIVDSVFLCDPCSIKLHP